MKLIKDTETCAVCGAPLYTTNAGLCGACKEFWPSAEDIAFAYIPAAADLTGNGEEQDKEWI